MDVFDSIFQSKYPFYLKLIYVLKILEFFLKVLLKFLIDILMENFVNSKFSGQRYVHVKHILYPFVYIDNILMLIRFCYFFLSFNSFVQGLFTR